MPSEPPSDVEQALNLQAHLLAERVQHSGMYLHEPREFDVARRIYPVIARRLGVIEDLGTLTTPESRNIVRKVRLSDGSFGVLKVKGNARELGEGEVLESWHTRGLPCVEPLSWGYQQAEASGSKTTTTYLLTRYLEYPSLSTPTDLESKRQPVRNLVRFMRQFHLSGAGTSASRTWEQAMSLHLYWTLPHLRSHGFPEPADWSKKLHRLSEDGQVLLHGDPAGRNVLVQPSGNLCLLDPAGARRGMREADVGQICSQVGGIDHVEEAIQEAWNEDPTLHPGAISCFAGINFLNASGYLLADHFNPDTESARQSSKSQEAVEPVALEWLSVASRLIGAYQLEDPEPPSLAWATA